MRFSRGMVHSAFLTVLVLMLILFSNCFFFPSSGFPNSIKIEGYIRSSLDSLIIPEIEMTVSSRDTSYTDENGFYTLSFTVLTHEDSGDYREWTVQAKDIDGISNGTFAQMDSILIEIDPTHNGSTDFELDLYLDPR